MRLPRNLTSLLCLTAAAWLILPCFTNAAESLRLTVRQQVETAPNSGEYRPVTEQVAWDPAKTAIVVCDMWDNHWCQGAARRVAEMAPRMNEVLKAARRQGVFIIHCPSDTMDFYKDTPQRRLAQAAPPAEPKVPLQRWCRLDEAREGKLPIDDSDGGCDCIPRCKNYKAWTRQIAALEIADGDAITDSAEAYYLMRQRGIDNVIVLGVHTNMCVLGRPFSIRQLAYQGKNVVLMRDLTDTMYCSRSAPFVSHFTGTDLVIDHIEKHWCPTIDSTALLGGEPFRFSEDKRPRLVIISAEDEYRTEKTLPEFARKFLGKDFQVSFVFGDEQDRNDLPGIEKLKDADVALISIRRRVLPPDQMKVIRDYVESGKPLLGIRTASHAFSLLRNQEPPQGHVAWPEFDAEVLGGNYHNHYGNGPKVKVEAAPGAAKHPILTGVNTSELLGNGSLYKVSPLKDTTKPLLLGSIPDQPAEPIAWINQPKTGNRVFYTSFGHWDDFDSPQFQRLLLNAIYWAAKLDVPKEWPQAKQVEAKTSAVLLPLRKGGNDAVVRLVSQATPAPPVKGKDPEQPNPMTPAESRATFTVPDDLDVQLVLSEPVVSQPLFQSFDERGRLWVMQYLQYPDPAGLTMLSKDRWWRAVYDKVPPPPPRGEKGKDQITIHEDTDGDGAFDKTTTFLDGLNIATAFARGRGGVWVLNPPYLLFYPDRNNDDVPDGDPEVHLEGFGLEDTHSVVNSLRWGPDGWLYAAQGSTVTGNVKRTGLDKDGVRSLGQLIWRYHPETRRYEIFAEGGGNAFGVEIDSKGRIFSGHNGGNTRGFHYVQGGYLQKGFTKHGPLSNPYAFGYFAAMQHHNVPRFTHTFLIYEGAALPAKYDGKLFGVAPLLFHVVMSNIVPEGSSFKTQDIGYAIDAKDHWFRPVHIVDGPDGALYVADWYDGQLAHTANYQLGLDRERGRIYRIQGKGAKPIQPFDLGKKSSAELVAVLDHPNRWFRQTALRLLGDRKDKSIIPRLKQKLDENDGQPALEALWALNLSGGLDEAAAIKLLDHPNPYVRLWTVRLLADGKQVAPAIADKLIQRALAESSVEARSQLASSAKRLSADQGLPVVRNLLTHDEDTTDIYVPLLVWWALESKCDADREKVLALFEETPLWHRKLVEDHILSRLMRRFAASGHRNDLLICARLLRMSPDDEHTKLLMRGFEEAYQGRSLSNVPEELLKALSKAGGGSVALRVRQGDAAAIDEAIQTIADEKAESGKRVEYAQLFGQIRQPKALPVLLNVLRGTSDDGLRSTILTTLQAYPDERIADEVLAIYGQLPEEVRGVAQTLLVTRKPWALSFLQAIDAGRIDPQSIPLEVVRRLTVYPDERITSLVRKHWGAAEGASAQEMQAQIRHYAAILNAGPGDPYPGKKLYMQMCGKCHVLHAQGGQIGPDLTPFKRTDVPHILLNVINPSAEIREGFETMLVQTSDGRIVTGFLVDQDPQVVVLRGADGQTVSIPRDEIDDLAPTRKSLMPEGQLKTLTDQQVRDLFAYLRSSQPLNDGQ